MRKRLKEIRKWPMISSSTYICVRSDVLNFDLYLKILENRFPINFNVLLDIIVYKSYFVVLHVFNAFEFCNTSNRAHSESNVGLLEIDFH